MASGPRVSLEPTSGQDPRWRALAACLELFPVRAFATDRWNRIVLVNRTFARLVGDPDRDRLPWSERFVPAAMVGPYRERFPRGRGEIARCLSGLDREVEAGNLATGTRRLIQETLDADAALRRAAAATTREWDGTIVVREPGGALALVREQVVPVQATGPGIGGFHLSFWLPVGRDAGPSAASGDPTGHILSLLTPRQRDIAQLFSSGLTAHDVATAAGISWRTARAHLEEIYGRLGVHSRAELVLALARAKLI